MGQTAILVNLRDKRRSKWSFFIIFTLGCPLIRVKWLFWPSRPVGLANDDHSTWFCPNRFSGSKVSFYTNLASSSGSQLLLIAQRGPNLKIRPGPSVPTKKWSRRDLSFWKSLHGLKSYDPFRFSLSLEIFLSVEKFVSCWRTKFGSLLLCSARAINGSKKHINGSKKHLYIFSIHSDIKHL